MVVRVYAKGPGDLGSIPGRVIPKTKNGTWFPLLNTQHYKVRIKGKVKQSKERSSPPRPHLSVVAIEKGHSGHPRQKGDNFAFIFTNIPRKIKLTIIYNLLRESMLDCSKKIFDFSIIIIIISFPWCNGYRRRKWTRWHEFKSCMYVRAGRLAFAQLYVGVHRNTSLTSSSLLLQQCPACLVRLTWIVFMMGGRCSVSSTEKDIDTRLTRAWTTIDRLSIV